MSHSYPAVPAKPSQVLSFPSKDKPEHWKNRFERIIDQGKGHFLCFPFTYIRNKNALFDLYEAAGKVFEKYPAVADEFFDDADRACVLAEQSIEDERRRNAPGDPADLIQFRPICEKEVSRG